MDRDLEHRAIERTILILAIALFVVVVLVTSGHAGITVTLREEASIKGAEIPLGSIAAVSGGDSEARSKFERVTVGQSPIPGGSRTVDLDTVKLRLRQARLDVAGVTFAGADRVAVSRVGRRVTSDEIIEAAREAVRERIGQTGDQIEIEPLSQPQEILVPVGALSLRGVLRGDVTSLAHAVVEIWVDDLFQRSVSITLRVDRLLEVMVASRAIRRQAVLTEDEFRPERRASGRIPPGAFSRSEDVAGKQAVRDVRAGEVLTSRALQPPPVVQKGDLVTLVVEGKGFRITASGKANEAGRPGQFIRVTNLASRKELYGRVDEGREVRISH
jgi:flagella basal body P-ring formation protein FlgA